MMKLIHGKVWGKTIELTDDLGMAEGQVVELSVRPVPEIATRVPGNGLVRTEGALADDPHWDAIMDEIYRERKNDARRDITE